MAPTQIEADLQRYYRRRVAEFWRTIGPSDTGEMTPRELCVLVDELPDESRFKRSRLTAWTLLEQLLATSVNISHGMREDYRSRYSADYDWSVVKMPELEHIRAHREAEEQRRIPQRELAGRVYEAMLTGRLRMSQIDMNTDIEEVLAAL